jgi:hypothetical protein
MEPKYLITDIYGESVRAFDSKEGAKAFLKNRPECRMELLPEFTHNDLDELGLGDKYP